MGPNEFPEKINDELDQVDVGSDALWQRTGVGPVGVESWERWHALAICAALLTIPRLQCVAPRLECLAHLVAALSVGDVPPECAVIEDVLNVGLHDSTAHRKEDPAEDVFIGNVGTSTGNFRIFQDTCTNNDYYLAAVLEAAEKLSDVALALKPVLESAYALLALSERVCKKLGLERWTLSDSQEQANIEVGPLADLTHRHDALLFSVSDLAEAGIGITSLASFVLTDPELRNPGIAEIRRTDAPLRKRPVVRYGDALLLALPNGVGSAVRRFVGTSIASLGLASEFSSLMGVAQFREVFDCFQRTEATVNTHEVPVDKDLPQLFSFDFNYDYDHSVLVLLLAEDVPQAVVEGDYSTGRFSDAELKALDPYVSSLAQRISANASVVHRSFIVIWGGIGRRRMLPIPEVMAGWNVMSFDAPDIVLLMKFQAETFRHLMKARIQGLWLEAQGVEIYNPSGDFGMYCSWRESDYKLIPQELSLTHGRGVMLLGDFMATVRQSLRRLNDEHMLLNHAGVYIPVARYGQNSYFRSHEKVPLYACPEAASSRVLAGAAKTEIGTRWLVVFAGHLDLEGRRNAHHIWSSFLHKFYDVVAELDRISNGTLPVVLEVCLEVGRVAAASTHEGEEPAPLQGPIVRPFRPGVAMVILPANFYLQFMRLDNAAERVFLQGLAEGVRVAADTLGVSIPSELADSACDAALPLGGAKIIHAFALEYSIDRMLDDATDSAVYVDEADLSFARIGCAGDLAKSDPYTIKGKKNCTDSLNKMVDEVWKQIESILQTVDRRALLDKGFRSIEAIHSDNAHWRKTANAVLSLHGNEAVAAAFKQDQIRSQTSLATRILMEMAVCECPVEGGGELSLSEYEWLLALVSLLIEVAYDSDAVDGGLIEPEMMILPNGEYGLDKGYQRSIVLPFVANQFEGNYRAAAGEYEEIMKGRFDVGARRDESPYEPEFSQAFTAEYGLSPESLLECTSELLDMAVRAESKVVRTTVGEIRASLIANRRCSSEVCDAFFNQFCLKSRPQWALADKPFKFRQDIAPWRFRRRLSIMARPVLIDGVLPESAAIFGIAQLINSWNYVTSRASIGRFPQEFFASSQMRAFVGHAANKHGALFEEEVAELLRAEGWQASTRVLLTSLGGTQAQGDVDVLAWRGDGTVLAIECKWLQQAGTVKEITEILKKFAGEERDNLDKHLGRIRWLVDHPQELIRKVKPIGTVRFFSLLVTDTDVPMMYVGNLPIPAADVVPLRKLAERVGALIA